MNICIVTPIFPPQIGGPAIYVDELARRLSNNKHFVTILVFGEAYKPQNELISVVSLKINYSFLGTLRRQANLLIELIKQRHKMDIIYIQDPITVGVTSVIFAKFFNKPTVTKFVGDIAWEIAHGKGLTDKSLEEFLAMKNIALEIKILKMFQKLVFFLCDKIIVASLYMKNNVVKFYKIKGEKIDIVHNATPSQDDFASFKESFSASQCNLLTIGRLVRWKNIDSIISAIDILNNQYGVPTKLIIVGEGPEEQNLKELVSKLKLEKNVEFTGRLSHKETLKKMKQTDIFILNSTYESLTHVLSEAMSCKTPMIAPDIAGTTEIAIHEENCLRVFPRDVKGIANTVKRLVENSSLRKKLVDNGFKLYLEQFNWDMTFPQIENKLKTVAKKT